MNVKNIERNGNETTIVVEIDKDLMESGINKAYMKARKSIMIPGFRKGKAPRKMIESMYGAHVFYEDGLEEIFPQVYQAAVIDQGIKAIGRPSLEDMQISEENIVTLTLKTEVYPEVTLGEYKGIEVEKAEAVVSDEQVQAELDRMAQNVASTETVERAAEMGDTANIDFEGFDNGVPFDGGKGEGFDLKLGSNQFVPGFEEQIVGMAIGEEKEINITFPENYVPDLAGKAVIFKVKVNEVKEHQLPVVDDEFAKDISEFETLEELKKDLGDKLMERRQEQAQNDFENAIMAQLIDNMEVTIPDAMVEVQLDRVMEDFKMRLNAQGLKMEDYAAMMGGDINTIRASARPAARRQVEMELAMTAIAKAENFEITEEEIEAELQKMAEEYKLEIEKIKAIIPVEDLKKDMCLRKASELVMAEAKVGEAPAKEA